MKRNRPFLLILSIMIFSAQLGWIVQAEETYIPDIEYYVQEKTADELAQEAAEAEWKTEEELEQEAEEKEQARQQATYDLPVDTNALANWPAGPSVYAPSAIVMDMESGAILYGKAVDEPHYPASITKLLTVLVALENGDLNDTITFSDDSINFLEYGDASVGMKIGEQISLNDALYAILLASANEVSYAVAENIGQEMGGDYQTFIDAMNEKAVELGCTNSNWVNPNGLHDDAHYTTVHDMALIASALYQEETFRNIEQTLEYRIGTTNLTEEERVFQQNHKMLWEGNAYYYEWAKAGKTGFTNESGNTLVTMADNGELQLAAVVMKDYGSKTYVDTQAMLDYVFEQFHKVYLEDQTPAENIKFVGEPYVVLPEGVAVSDLECEIVTDEEETKVITGTTYEFGTASYTYQGQKVGTAQIVRQVEDTPEEEEPPEEETETEPEPEEPSIDPRVWIAGSVAVIFLGVILWAGVRRARKKRK